MVCKVVVKILGITARIDNYRCRKEGISFLCLFLRVRKLSQKLPSKYNTIVDEGETTMIDSHLSRSASAGCIICRAQCKMKIQSFYQEWEVNLPFCGPNTKPTVVDNPRDRCLSAGVHRDIWIMGR